MIVVIVKPKELKQIASKNLNMSMGNAISMQIQFDYFDFDLENTAWQI